MKLVSFSVEGGAVKGGLWFENGVLPFDAAAAIIDSSDLDLHSASVLNVVCSAQSVIDRLTELDREVKSGGRSDRLLPLDSLTLLAPIPRPTKNIFCVGRNYLDHVKEGYKARGTELKVPEFIQLFSKPPTTVIGTGADIRYDEQLTQKLDYEAELGLVIGKSGRDIRPENALEHIFGYTVINDVTARDLQRAHDQWFKGKGLDTSCPMGPWIVTKDEVADAQNLDIRCTVNGEVRQSSNTSMMIFKLQTIIAELSRGLTLEAGDIIATGTPSGVGYAMEPPRLLNVGDVVEVSVSGVGTIRNTVVAA
ncbi:fumarylacetoacetate hydrolase family protein [Burkholderia multivorans]|uniref:fumarylacetoacetate hydrolase family protein n=1 Tax=Burkholderia multivorans TaxID=87883 RepID=UPI00209F47F9|nr:fumarylacetoacetate hydrolase family protein [Burkholderia multivorans]MCO8612093.1 fumarylacetoacetate hydrolase family protein [Burkholderia multivorans]MCO8638436.1 fumarylacetoacetate hydrolase family protein [Burkholderia multivorans]